MLIIVNGFSCTGKTVLADRLSKKLNLPLFSVDSLKEMIMDSLEGVLSVDALFHRYSQFSYNFIYSIAEKLIEVGYSTIIESSFHNNETNILRINSLHDTYGISVKQIFLYANKEVVWDRIQKRKKDRHSGHTDLTMTYENFLYKIESSKKSPLDIKGELLKVDTTYFEKVDLEKLIEFSNS